MKQIRCAIYTRKSSDEGLEQGFNSLDAQREACAAYILSQASEGWSAIPTIYDDGGFSGGTLERPSLQRLLADVDAGRVDIIVVYKVDRLTRSLLDFSNLVERFDNAGASFVSITQSFNTTTSMGRLTLNMLLSFAQFEREVTAERIRDKIAASKAKGMWMGGIPPLGYKPDGRTLAIVEEEARLIRHIHSRYLELGAVRLLANEFSLEEIKTPIRTQVNGKMIGGGTFSRGQLYSILKNPIYVGDIPHKDITYPGLHDAIIDRDIWNKVQAQLAEKVQGERRGRRGANANMLAGLVVDAEGETMLAAHSSKTAGPNQTRYRYYVSKPLHHRDADDGARIPASELDAAVIERVGQLFSDPVAVANSAELMLDPAEVPRLVRGAAEVAASLAARDRELVSSLIQQVRVMDRHIEIDVSGAAIADALQVPRRDGATPVLALTSDASLRRSGRAMKLVYLNGAAVKSEPDTTLVRLLARAHRWWNILREGEINLVTLASQEGVTRSYMARVVRLAFLSPEVVAAIVDGRQPARLSHNLLTATDAVAPDWRQQRAQLLAA